MEYTVGSSPRRVAAVNNNSSRSRRGGSSIGSASSQSSSSPSIPMSYSTDTSADRLVAGASPLATTTTTLDNEQGGGGEIAVKALSAAYDLPPAYDLHRSSENTTTAPAGKKYKNYNNNTTTNNNANANSNSTAAAVGGKKGEASSSLLAGSMNGFGSFGTSASSSKYTTEDSLGDSYYLGEDDDEDNETNLHSSVASLSMSSPYRSGSGSRIGGNVHEDGGIATAAGGGGGGGSSSVMDFFSNNTQHNDTTTTQNNSNSNSNNNNASRYTNNEGSTAVEDVTTIIRQNYNTLLTILSNPEAFTDDNSNSNVMMVEHIKQQTQQSTNKYRYSIYRQLLE